MILSGFSVFSFYDPPKATSMTPAIDDTGLPCVEPGKQRAEPFLWAIRSSGSWELLLLSLSEATMFLGVYFLLQFGKLSSAFTNPSTFFLFIYPPTPHTHKGFLCVVPAVLELTPQTRQASNSEIRRHPPPECWDQRHVPPRPANIYFL